jgi:peptide-methionine (S)-S-oxide reductase
LLLLLVALACSSGNTVSAPAGPPPGMAAVPEAGPGQAVAVFAGGCFWCLETDFDHLDGVVHTTSGYAGGHTEHPTYDDVNTETTGHKEAVRVVYDTSKLDYAKVLDWYWHHVDPTDDGGQFCDRGDSYRTAIFPVDDEQKRIAEESKAAIDASGALPSKIVTPIVPGATFWPAEEYHQDFHDKDPGRYLPYRRGCGRDARVKELWGS